MIDPKKDGIDHINIYSKGKTELGQLLSNFAHTPVELENGPFESLEGYWYWLLSDKSKECWILSELHGWKAKEIGRKLTKNKDWLENLELFGQKFMIAMKAKITQHPNIYKLLKKSTLPFKHYYVYGGKVVEVNNCKWILDFWEEYRNDIQSLRDFDEC